MILQSITIHNFQSIKEATLEMAGWVSLVGESDIAKSAVVRAMHAALTNRTGDALIRHGAPGCSVWLTLATGEVIGWHKKRGKGATYTLWRPGQREPETFDKTNGTVPEAIAALLRVTIDIAGDDMTPGFQRQHDAPFLLSDTPRRRAQILGEFDGTNITIRAEGLIRTTQRRAQSEVKASEKALEGLIETLDGYDGLASAQARLSLAELAQTLINERRLRIDKVKQAAARVRVQAGVAEVARSRAAILHGPPVADVDALTPRAARVAAARSLAHRIAQERARASRSAAAAAAYPAIDYGPGFAGRTQRLNDGARLVARWRHSRAVAARSGAIHAALASAPDVAARAERVQQGSTLLRALAAERLDFLLSGGMLEEYARQMTTARAALAALRGEACPVCGGVMQLTEVP